MPPSSPTKVPAAADRSTAVAAAPSARSSRAGSVGVVTTNSGSRPRRRTSTEPGASSHVISWAAAASASNSDRRIAASSGATRPSGKRPCGLTAGLGSHFELVMDLVYVWPQVHVCHYGITLASYQAKVVPLL